MRVSFELGERDLRYFRDRLHQVRNAKSGRAEDRVILGAMRLLDTVEKADPPEFVKERMGKLACFIDMLRDEGWALEGADRERIVDALAYFVDPEDIIPDRIPGLGYLDDAIMVELVVTELRPELDAYTDFCSYRGELGERDDAEKRLGARRSALHARITRRRKRDRTLSRSSKRAGRPTLRLW